MVEPYNFAEAHKKYGKKKEKVPEAPYQTVLERRPEYLKAIGTISVEIVNMEIMLADLFGVILRIPEHIAHAIFFSPQATGPRLAILANASAEALNKHPVYKAQVDDCVGRARKYANMRNDIMHEAWGTSEGGDKIARRKAPLHLSAAARPIDIKEIENTIYQTRVLISNVVWLCRSIESDKRYRPSKNKSSEPDKPGKSRSKNPLKSPPAK